ncbi:hypothetical protein TD95_002382 [Thielaviopsis punctulata]|uniref:Nucleoporin n=1 Tax=Thielaviopsis punctulata TaxID=72032 RepID=A0A0F4ZGH3_9PEZI|nr:hypothetical protein TD95_002382 [Thielaviopsis punctulata]
MAEFKTLEALTELHRDLLSLSEGRLQNFDCLDNDDVLGLFEAELEKFWTDPGKSEKSRTTVNSGKVKLGNETYDLNDEFKKDTLTLADEANIDEIDAVQYMIEAQDDTETMGQPLLELALIRLHRTRTFTLDIARLFVDLNDRLDNETIFDYVNARIFLSGAKRIVPRCTAAMEKLKTKIQTVLDKLTAVSVLTNGARDEYDDSLQTIYFIRSSLYHQHQLVAHILTRSIEKRQSESEDFTKFIDGLKTADKYDALLIHKIPVLGAYITEYASTEGRNDVALARKLNPSIFPSVDSHWPMRGLQAAVKVWWLAEFGGHFMGTQPEPSEAVRFEAEDKKRTADFMDALKEGAFDFLLSMSSDVRSPEWQDPARSGMRQWLQRRLPALPSDSVAFPESFQMLLMSRIEMFVDGFISNLPDVIRKLRIDEDEQRQMSQAHEQDLDLERFLIIIAYAYEGRPDSAMNFWADPDSNLAGFMQWASRRASTPLVTAFCEMLQAISPNEECATSAHQFLIDEGTLSSGRLRKSLSLTWNQILRELVFFTNKIREKPNTPAPTYRHGKPVAHSMDIEPESAMMLECYLRLITRLASQSEEARNYLLRDPAFNLVEILLQLASNPVPPRLRACVFWALDALMAARTVDNSHVMWVCLDAWATGAYTPLALSGAHKNQIPPSSVVSMENILSEVSKGFEEPYAFITLLTTLVSPIEGSSPLRDSLTFPETLGSLYRMSGIELYVDYVMGYVFSDQAGELEDKNQRRLVRQKCLEFCLVCIESFNEDLIEFANVTNINVDAAISTSSLEAYIRMHPFARIMEWMMNEKVMSTIFGMIHESPMEVGNSPPNSPLIQGILNAIKLLLQVLKLQPTYVNIVRKALAKNSNTTRSTRVATTRYASFDDCLVGHLSLVVDLGLLCGIAPTDVVCESLHLLERMSSSQKIVSVWSSSSGSYVSNRNKAIVAMEADGDHEKIIGYFHNILNAFMDPRIGHESDEYITKMHALEFLYQCLRSSPTKPTIAHLLLGFKCHADSVSIDPNGSFAQRKSLFHQLLNVWVELPFADNTGVRQWLTTMKTKALMILKHLWSSPLTSELVLDDLRMGSFVFSLLQETMVINADIPWENHFILTPVFPLTEGAKTFNDFMSHRAASLDYISRELCYLSQAKLPTYKRRLFDALKGKLYTDAGEILSINSIFDLFDFISDSDVWDIEQPQLVFYNDVNFDPAKVAHNDEPRVTVFDLDRANEIMLLKRSENRDESSLMSAQDIAAIDREDEIIVQFMAHQNITATLVRRTYEVLRMWTNLVLVVLESNDFHGTARTMLFLQTLQTIMPILELTASERIDLAAPLAQLAKILMFKLDASTPAEPEIIPLRSGLEPIAEENSQDLGTLVGDKLYQLFQTSLQAIGRYVRSSDLRATYYSICYCYLTGVVGANSEFASHRKVLSSITVYGERLANVICDDAYSGDPPCQAAALVLLNALVNMARVESDFTFIDILSRINFIGIMVDSLRNVLNEATAVVVSGASDLQNVLDAKLSLLLQLCQTREGAKHAFHANLLRNIEVSGLFSVDPELHVDQSDNVSMTKHYALLARVARIIGVSIISRGSQHVPLGRKFIIEHRMLITHTLKRSAGIGHVNDELSEAVEDLADAFLVLMVATNFVDFENESVPDTSPTAPMLYH